MNNVNITRVNVRNVNEAPVASPLPAHTLLEDAPAGTVATSFAFSDPDGDTLTWSVSVLNPSTPFFSAITINAQTGVLSYDTAPDVFGTASLRIVATDAGGLTAASTMSIVVQPVNDAPIVQSFSTSTTGTSLLASGLPGVLTGARDAESSPLQVMLVSGSSNGTLTLNANGSFTYRADSGFFGQDSFEFAASDGTLISATGTATITVRPVAVNPNAQQGSGSSSTGTPVQAQESQSTANGTSTGTTGQGSTTGSGSSSVPTGNPTPAMIGSSISVNGAPGTSGNSQDLPAASPISAFLVSQSSSAATARSMTLVATSLLNSGASNSVANRRSVELRPGIAEAATQFGVGDSQSARGLQQAIERDLFYRHLAEATTSQAESFEERLANTTNFDARVVGSVGVVTTGFSVGYLLWIVRGGMLLSGLLAQMPAWTMVDPLLVVDDKQKDDDDKESLQTLMDRQQAELNSRKVEQKPGDDRPAEAKKTSQTPSTPG